MRDADETGRRDEGAFAKLDPGARLIEVSSFNSIHLCQYK
jgi:hypothetical protein